MHEPSCTGKRPLLAILGATLLSLAGAFLVVR
jgi:hypothetical protein